jgi:hypothetical protein
LPRLLNSHWRTLARPTIPNEHEQRYIITATPRGWFYPLYNFLKDFLATFRIKI